MSCSKIFSGDMPEISTYIIRNLRNNLGSLYSCTLINRFWCRLAIPLLWEDPFSSLNCHFLDTYFSFLNDDDKNKIKEIKINNFDSNLHKPLFNYPSLIKTLNLTRIQLHSINWLNSTYSTSSFPITLIKHLQIISHQEFKLIRLYEANEMMQTICVILFKLFIENHASLNELFISVYYPYSQNHVFHDVHKMILNNPSFISNMEKFTCQLLNSFGSTPQTISPNIKSLQTFLPSLPSLCNSIKHIDLFINNIEFENYFENIIQSQPQLTSIKIRFSMLYKVPLLDSLKYSSNTLTSIHFYSCNLSDNIRFDALTYLTQLESLQFKNCIGLMSNVIKPFLNITSPLKIKTFVIIQSEIQEILSVELLIQKIGPYIKNLVLGIYNDELREKLFNIVINFCDKVKFLHLNYIDFTNVPQLSKMILNFDNYLKYLTLQIKFYGSLPFNVNLIDHENDLERISSMILKELNKSLPLSLCYLDLNLVINPNDLQMVFEKCKRIELKKLLIRNRSKKNLDITLNIIKEFVKEKNLECLAYGIGESYKPEDELYHKKFEKLVKETQSFVKMKKYDDLVIIVSEIDGNLIIN